MIPKTNISFLYRCRVTPSLSLIFLVPAARGRLWCVCRPSHMTVQGIGIQQQLQSSPHQHPCLMGTLGPLEEAVEEVVDGGIVVVVVAG